MISLCLSTYIATRDTAHSHDARHPARETGHVHRAVRYHLATHAHAQHTGMSGVAAASATVGAPWALRWRRITELRAQLHETTRALQAHRLRETWHENERIHEHARVTGRSGECERRLVADLVLHAARGGGELVGSICAWRRPREVSRARARQAVLMARAMSIPDPSARLIDARKRACPKRSSRRIVRTRRG